MKMTTFNGILYFSVFIGPGMNRILGMHGDNHGTWLFHCHMDAHMMALYRVFSNTSEVNCMTLWKRMEQAKSIVMKTDLLFEKQCWLNPNFTIIIRTCRSSHFGKDP